MFITDKDRITDATLENGAWDDISSAHLKDALSTHFIICRNYDPSEVLAHVWPCRSLCAGNLTSIKEPWVEWRLWGVKTWAKAAAWFLHSSQDRSQQTLGTLVNWSGPQHWGCFILIQNMNYFNLATGTFILPLCNWHATLQWTVVTYCLFQRHVFTFIGRHAWFVLFKF